MSDEMTTTNETVLDFVIKKIENIETWKKDPGTPASMEDVAALLDSSVPKGPADVTALYDFYTMDIAFENVWEEIFGNQIGQLGQRLYTFLAKEKDTAPGEDVEIAGLADVDRLLAEARSVLEQRVALAGVPEAVKEFLPQVTAETWGALGFEGRRALLGIVIGSQSEDLANAFTIEDEFGANAIGNITAALSAWYMHIAGIPDIDHIFVRNAEQVKTQFRAISDYLDGLEGAGGDPNQKEALDLIEEIIASQEDLPEGDKVPLIAQVAEALKEPHAFKVYANRSVNFGVLLNYRQEWDPQTYQVGELINTIPLAPKEVRKYTKKQTFKESRKRKEVNNALSIRRGETAQTNRSQAEIVNRANEKTAFNASASVSGSIGAIGFNGSSNLSTDSAKDSARTKKNFRESVAKAAQELKNEQKLDIEISSENELEDTMTGEISNPNEEIAVTYLFYELQRRYKVHEYLHDATPVILVANEVPNPDEIDEAWLLRHEWILRRFILDDNFLKAFYLLKKARSGKNIEIDTLRTHVEQQLRAFADTKIELETYTKARASSERELRAAVEKYAQAVNADASTLEEMGETVSSFLSPGGVFGNVHDFFFGRRGPNENRDTAEDPEAAQARQEAVEEALSRIDRSITDTRTRMQGIATALDQAIDKYMIAVRTRLDGELALMNLRVHVKDNILYYMQAIWDHEPPDQRFYRLCDIEVPTFGEFERLVEIRDDSNIPDHMATFWLESIGSGGGNPYVTFKEVADLDNLLGYKGNYMIFPLVTDHKITDFMMEDYLDENFQIKDPDESLSTILQGTAGEQIWTGLRQNVADKQIQPVLNLLGDELNQGKIDPKEFDLKVENLQGEYEQRLNTFREELLKDEPGEDIVVPSDLLFIAALPGTDPVLEDFKLKHRGIDVLKAAAELEEQQVELIRHKARLLGKELEDPDIDKSVKIESNTNEVEVDVGVQ